jgi:hypothetical protein
MGEQAVASRAPHTGVLLAALVVAVVVSLTGCGRPGARGSSNSETATPTAAVQASATAIATGTQPAAQTAASATQPTTQEGSPASASEPISASDAKAIDAELSAIQSELDRLSLPSDDDFDSIGSGLE